MTTLYNGYEFPKQTMEQARRSQAHWHGIDADEWWAYCEGQQGKTECPECREYAYNGELGR